MIQGAYELVKDELRFDRSRGRLRVELNREQGTLRVPHSFVSAVVGVEKPGFPTRGQALFVYRETVVLRRNIAPFRADFQARLVLAPMAVLELESIRAGAECKELVTQTDA